MRAILTHSAVECQQNPTKGRLDRQWHLYLSLPTTWPTLTDCALGDCTLESVSWCFSHQVGIR